MRDALDLLQFLWPFRTNPLISLLRKSRYVLHPHPGHSGGPKPRAQQGERGLWSPTDLDWNPAVSFASDATLTSLSLGFFSCKMGVRKVYTSLGDCKNYMISYMWSTWHMALYFVKVHDRYVLGTRSENSDFLVSLAGEGTQQGWRVEHLEEGCLGLITLSTFYY